MGILISALNPLDRNIAPGDELAIVDVSDATQAASGTTKRVYVKDAIYSPATLVVAPTDSDFRADYYTDGTADEVQINEAIAALPSTGGKIILKEGVYNLAGAINILKSFTQIEGEGWATVLHVNNSTNIYAFTFTPAGSTFIKGTKISDLKIECNGANQSSGGGGIYCLGAVWCVFERMWIDEPNQNGFYLYNDNLGNFGHHNVIRDCLFEHGQNSASGDGRGVLLEQSDENVIVGCTFQENGRFGATESNHIYDKAGLNTFLGNQFVTGQTGLKIQGQHSRAIGNTFDGCQNHSMRINGNKNTIIGNEFYNIGFGGGANNQDGLWIDNVGICTIIGNLFIPLADTTFCRSGINMQAGSAGVTNCVIADNIFTLDSVGTATFATAPIIIGNGTGHMIHHNQGFVTENSGTAIVANGQTTIAVTHGLGFTPAATQITVTPTNSMGNAAKSSIGTFTSTQFTITVDANPGATTATFAWQAKRN